MSGLALPASLDAASGLVVERLLAASVTGALFAAAVWLACRRLPDLPPGLRCGLWWLVALKLVVGLVLPPIELPLLPAEAPQADARPAVAAPAPEAEAPAPLVLDAAAAEPPAPALAATPPRPEPGLRLGWPTLVAALWLAGVGGGLLLLGRELGRLRRLRRAARPLVDGPVVELAEELAGRLGLRRTPRIAIADAIAGPQVTGVLRPLVLLPRRALERLDRRELAMALCHELLHVRRRDLALGWLPALAGTLFFFHPLARLAGREYSLAREAACDAGVLELLGTAPRVYGRFLLNWGVAPRESGLAAAGAAPSLVQLKRRLEMLRSSSAERRRPSPWRWAVAGAALVALVPLTLVAAPPEPPPAPPAPEAAPAPPQPPAVTPLPAPEPLTAPAPLPPMPPGATPAPLPSLEPLPRPALAPAPLPSPGSAPRLAPRAPGLPAPELAPLPEPSPTPRLAPLPELSAAPARPPRAPAPPVRPVPAPEPRTAPAPPLPPSAALALPAGPAPGPPDPALAAATGVRRLTAAGPAVAPRPGRPPALARTETAVRERAAARAASSHRERRAGGRSGDSYSYHWSSAGDAFVLLDGDADVWVNGDRGDVARARELRGDSDDPVLWFRRGSDAYVLRDRATIDEVRRLFEPVRALGRQQGELGREQGELGRRQGELGREQGRLGAEQGRLGAEQARLAAERARRGRDADTSDLDRRHEELARRMEELAAQQAKLGERQESLGAEQGRLGSRQEELGRRQEKVQREAQEKLRALFDRAISSGTAERVD